MSDSQELLALLLSGATVIFKPANKPEAARVQRVLMALGFVWGDGDTKICAQATCVKYGMKVRSGLMSTVGEDEAVLRLHSCKTLLALDIEDIMGVSTTPLMQAFHLVNGNQRRIEDKLDRLLDKLEPKIIGKQDFNKGNRGVAP